MGGGLSRWGWYNALETIAERDITKFKSILDLGAREVFTHLSYLRDYHAMERQLLKQNFKRNV